MITNKLLVCPFMVQGHTTPEFEKGMGDTRMHGYGTVKDECLISEAKSVAAIRAVRNNTMRSLLLNEKKFDASSLDSPRVHTWWLAQQLLQNEDSGLYILRDQNQYTEGASSTIFQSQVDKVRIFIRAEEGLLPIAEELIDTIKISATTAKAMQNGIVYDRDADEIIRSNQNGSVSNIPLYGYEFAATDTIDNKRTYFSHYPSCEIFLAAAAIEAASLTTEGLIRVFTAGIKNREYAARTLCDVAGYECMPLESISVGTSGSINKIFSWDGKTSRSEAMRTRIRTAINEITT